VILITARINEMETASLSFNYDTKRKRVGKI
jgi:hypothetical protein